jgi:3-phosphoshikimate 1-carboxyvinyltransferase
MKSNLTSAHAYISQTSPALKGSITVPGDKSISHRTLMLGSQIFGKLHISGLLEGEDVLSTMQALRQMGVSFSQAAAGGWVVEGRGIGGLNESADVLNMGNSGTSARLLMGLLAPYPFTSFFSGDHSLSRRPMKRVMTPLKEMGVQFTAHSGETLPLALMGSSSLLPITYTLPVASAQVKSAILLAGMNIAGKTTVIEKEATRDHTERMLKHLGIALEITEHESGGQAISITGHQKQAYQETEITVPGDPSSAAFPIVAALITPGSEITVQHICMNPLRTGLFDVLTRMGADISFHNKRESAGEPVADITARYSKLKAVDVEAEIAPSMIDEYPILAVACAYAKGRSIMKGLSELRVKESDRLQAVIDGLTANGVRAEAQGDDLIVHGAGAVPGGGLVRTHYDHRIAMAFLVMGLAAQQQVTVDDARAIATSFPNFFPLMSSCGAAIFRERRTKPRIDLPHPLVIAIDGPAASGKGTLGRCLSEHLGLPYLDTGSLYRAVGMRILFAGNDPTNKDHAIAAAESIAPDDFSNPQLRYEKVGQAASIVSAMPEVRQILLDYQRRFAASARGAILDGRDIGTVVCPNADIKLFMTASIEARADRRHRQLQGQGIEVVYESVLQDLIERDARDSERKSAPLKAADDAIAIDTTDVSANQVFDMVIKLVESRLAVKAA